MPLITDDIGNFTAKVNGFVTAFPGTPESLSFQRMSDLQKIVGRIESRLDALNISASAASIHAGLSKDAIRNMQRGLANGVNVNTLQRLAPALKTTFTWLLDGVGDEQIGANFIDPNVSSVRLVGYVGASAAAFFTPSGHLGEVPRPSWAGPETVAVEIRGDSLGPLFDRWVVYYDDVRRPVSSDLIGRLCVVGLADGRVLIKKIQRGKRGFFDLISHTERPIRNIEIEWAARVKQMVPR